jgi:hypothetical protein
MKKWFAAVIILSILLFVSAGLNVFQMISGIQKTKTMEAPLNSDIEWGKYFVLQFNGDTSLYDGNVTGYGNDGSTLFDVGFSYQEKPVMFDNGLYGIDRNSLYIKLNFSSVTISRIDADNFVISNLPFAVKVMKIYYIDATGNKTPDGKTIATIRQ